MLSCADVAARLGRAGLWAVLLGLDAAGLCCTVVPMLDRAGLLMVGWDATTALGYDLGCFHSPNHGKNMEFGK